MSWSITRSFCQLITLLVSLARSAVPSFPIGHPLAVRDLTGSLACGFWLSTSSLFLNCGGVSRPCSLLPATSLLCSPVNLPVCLPIHSPPSYVLCLRACLYTYLLRVHGDVVDSCRHRVAATEFMLVQGRYIPSTPSPREDGNTSPQARMVRST